MWLPIYSLIHSLNIFLLIFYCVSAAMLFMNTAVNVNSADVCCQRVYNLSGEAGINQYITSLAKREREKEISGISM